jgi:tyrosine-protein kinase Etk/Wzc
MIPTNSSNDQTERLPFAPPVETVVQFDLLLLLARVVRGYKKLLIFGAAGFLIAVAIGAVLPKTYTANALFMPPVNIETATQAASLFSAKDPTDLYLGMLSSGTVADTVIDEVHLMDVYHAQYRTDAAVALASQSKFNVEKNALISVTITTGDPKLSAQIGNAYLDALYKLNGEMSSSASSHRSAFFEAQLADQKKALTQAELNMKEMEEKSGTVLPVGEAEAGVSASARLQADIQSEEARLSSLLTSSTEQNPQVISLRAGIAEMRSQLSQQQTDSRPVSAGLRSSAKMPAIMLDYLRASRDLKDQETLYTTLTQQYERARISSLDPGPQLQIVDKAKVPERKSGPPRKRIVIVGTFLGLLLGLLLILLESPVDLLYKRYRVISDHLKQR